MASFDLKPLPHGEAIAYFRSKGFAAQLQRFHHLDHFREEHARDFVVAKAMRDDVLKVIREEVDRALAEGRPVAEAAADLAPRLKELGWWGKAIDRDPQTGELLEVQLGSMRRLRTILDTNMRTAHAAGHWARIQRTKRAFPYLEYVQIERPSKRHDHARFHGHIWPVDDPVWLRIYPPNGFFCGCTVVQRTEGQLRRAGKAVSPPMDLDEEPWINKRTGEAFDVPKGVHPGFDANPGAAWLDLADAWDSVTPDLTPERRISEGGILQALRLRRVGDGRETLVITNAASNPVAMRSAEFETPARVSLAGLDIPPGASFIHSHVTEGSLSAEDLMTLYRHAGHAITAVTPGGSIWRAVRLPGADIRVASGRFTATALARFRDELRTIPQASELFAHARMLWLEKQGLIAYHFHMSSQVRQFMDAHAWLLQRLIDALPET